MRKRRVSLDTEGELIREKSLRSVRVGIGETGNGATGRRKRALDQGWKIHNTYNRNPNVWCSHDSLSAPDHGRHLDAGIVGVVHAHNLDAPTAVYDPVSEML